MDALSKSLQPFKTIVGTTAGIFTALQFLSGVFVCNDIRKKNSTKGFSIIPFLGGTVLWVFLRGVQLYKLWSHWVSKVFTKLILGFIAIQWTQYMGLKSVYGLTESQKSSLSSKRDPMGFLGHKKCSRAAHWGLIGFTGYQKLFNGLTVFQKCSMGILVTIKVVMCSICSLRLKSSMGLQGLSKL